MFNHSILETNQVLTITDADFNFILAQIYSSELISNMLYTVFSAVVMEGFCKKKLNIISITLHEIIPQSCSILNSQFWYVWWFWLTSSNSSFGRKWVFTAVLKKWQEQTWTFHTSVWGLKHSGMRFYWKIINFRVVVDYFLITTHFFVFYFLNIIHQVHKTMIRF